MLYKNLNETTKNDGDLIIQNMDGQKLWCCSLISHANLWFPSQPLDVWWQRSINLFMVYFHTKTVIIISKQGIDILDFTYIKNKSINYIDWSTLKFPFHIWLILMKSIKMPLKFRSICPHGRAILVANSGKCIWVLSGIFQSIQMQHRWG